MPGKREVKVSDVYESQDVRDTDPKQPNGLRRVRVRDIFTQSAWPATVRVENLTSGRRTLIAMASLQGSKWKWVSHEPPAKGESNA